MTRGRALVAIFVVLLLAFLASAGWSALGVVAYRKAPTYHRATLALHAKGWAPHDALAMAMILRRGSPSYRRQLRTDLYAFVGSKHFSPWTTWMLRNDFSAMSNAEFNLFVESYPGDFRDVHARILKSLDASFAVLLRDLAKAPSQPGADSASESEEVLSDEELVGRLIRVMDRYEPGRMAFVAWFDDNLLRAGRRQAFEKLADETCAFQGMDYDAVFPRLLSRDEEKAKQELEDLGACVPLTGVSGLTFSHQAQLLVRKDPDLAVFAASFFGRIIRAGGRALEPGEQASLTTLIARTHDCSLYPLYAEDRSANEKGDRAPSHDGDKRPKLRSPEAQLLFLTAARRQDSCASDFFGALASEDVGLAEELFAPFRNKPDFGLRKDMIVHLVNEDSKVGVSLIDQAFSGPARRSALFKTLLVYAEQSKAAAEYRQLASHDYLETGKQFPPIYKVGSASTTEIANWGAFINRYPWFPGADDAYYRLAYATYATGDREGALNVLRRYATLNLPDRDAEPYMLELVVAIANGAGDPNDLSEASQRELAIVRDYAGLPAAIATDPELDLEACRSRSEAFVDTPWLRALSSRPARDKAEPEEGQADLCEAGFGFAGNDTGKLATALAAARWSIGVALALPTRDGGGGYSEESLAGLAALNHAVAERVEPSIVAGSGLAATDARAGGWFLYLKDLNGDFDSDCPKKAASAYCLSEIRLKRLYDKIGVD